MLNDGNERGVVVAMRFHGAVEGGQNKYCEEMEIQTE